MASPQCGHTFTTGILLSCVSVAVNAIPKRKASVPYRSMTSSGSMPLPFIFDIVSPKPSRIFGWMYTWWNGIWPTLYRPVITMRATHSVMMSRLVTSVFVG